MDELRQDPPAGSQFYEALFVDGTDDTRDVLFVKIPAFDDDAVFGDPDGVVWSPIGGAVPQAGDRALVAESNDGTWWALAWWSSLQAVGTAPAGPFLGQVAMNGLVDPSDGWLACDGSPITSGPLRVALLAAGSPHGSSGGDPLLPSTPPYSGLSFVIYAGG